MNYNNTGGNVNLDHQVILFCKLFILVDNL